MYKSKCDAVTLVPKASKGTECCYLKQRKCPNPIKALSTYQGQQNYAHPIGMVSARQIP